MVVMRGKRGHLRAVRPEDGLYLGLISRILVKIMDCMAKLGGEMEKIIC